MGHDDEFREFLARVDRLIVTELLPACPDAEWRRVFKSWREEISWTVEQMERRDNGNRPEPSIKSGFRAKR